MTRRRRTNILLAPRTPERMVAAIEAGGGTLVTRAEDADAVVWLDPSDPGGLRDVLDAGADIRWVQLPFAGIEPFVDVLTREHVWTCGKGVYAEPVAEMVLGMLLAGMRDLTGYARATTWTGPVGRNLLGAHVVILGGGEITRSVVDLLAPLRCEVTVLRRRPDPFPGAAHVGTLDDLETVLPRADAVVLALALTPDTRHVIDARALELMPSHAWLVNVARGCHVDTDALVAALASGSIAGAALDVTDPEPLPDDHPLWHESRCLITPHTANTPEMGAPLLAARIRDNVARFVAGDELLGHVDVGAGY